MQDFNDDRRASFGEWLRDRRKNAGLTQQQAADQAKLARQQWIRLENGESGTRVDTIPRIAEAVRAPLAETYERAGFALPASVRAQNDADRDAAAQPVFQKGQRLLDRRRNKERVLHEVETLGRITYLTLRDPVSGEVERLPFVATTLADRFQILADTGKAFQGDASLVALVAEAMRLRHAYLFNPVFATETSLIDPLPHQLIAVYGLHPEGEDENAKVRDIPGMLDHPRLRFLLADDAGAGKTVMSGLYIREMLLRRLVRRILIISPAGLVGNWERELRNHFRLRFRIIESSDIREGDNPFEDPRFDRAILSLDTARQDPVRAALAAARPWDLVVCDEAHKLTARKNPDGSMNASKRYTTVEEIAARSTHLLLATATPHMGKDDPYFFLWRLLDPKLFSTSAAFSHAKRDVIDSHLLRRLKEEMVNFEGKPLFPPRTSKTISYALSPDEQALYEAVTQYIEDSYSRTTTGNRSAVGLALSVIQRRLASSTWALLRSLERRQERIAASLRRLEEDQVSPTDFEAEQEQAKPQEPDPRLSKTGDEEVSEDGIEEGDRFDEKVSGLTSSRTVEELQAELDVLERLVMMARGTYEKRRESKFDALREVLQNHPQTKILIFTEHKDTLDFLVQRMEGLGATGRIATIHGGMNYREREREAERFRSDDCPYLIATDAAGEGINLQFCWLLVNYDLPWNPARVEQRMGRVHRYKQQHDVLLVSLVAGETREGSVLKTLLDKLEIIRERLGSDKVFDVIGEQLGGASLSDLIFRATVQGQDIEAREAVEKAFDPDTVAKKLDQQKRRIALSEVKSLLASLKHKQETAEERRMMPAYVRSFFTQAVTRLGIEIVGDAARVFNLENMPDAVRRAVETYPETIQHKMTFDRRFALPTAAMSPEAIYLHPDEAVFEAVMTLFLGRYGNQAERGGIFYDPAATEPYLFALARIGVVGQEAITDIAPPGTSAERDERLPLAEDLMGVVYAPGGAEPRDAPAHHLLTLEPATKPEQAQIPEGLLELAADITPIEGFVLERHGIPLLNKVRDGMEKRLPEREQQLMTAFNLRMTEGMEQRKRLRDEQAKGNQSVGGRLRRLNEDLAGMTDARDRAIAELYEEIERLDLAPVTLYARAIALPLPPDEVERRRDTQAEDVAMRVAEAYEVALGAHVENVSLERKDAPGYDLRSHRPDGTIRYIEVKGRTGTNSVEMTANEWSQAANHQDRYWLYTVYHCETENPRLHRVADPFGRLLSHGGGVLLNAGEILTAADKSE